MSPILLTPGAFILLAIFCGFFSALAAALVIQTLAARHVREAIYKAVADANCILVRNVSCNMTVRAEDGRLIWSQNIETSGPEASAQFVENWLDRRDLVMCPKGQDFGKKVKAP